MEEWDQGRASNRRIGDIQRFARDALEFAVYQYSNSQYDPV